MKNKLGSIAISTLIAGAFITGCQSNEKKVENAKVNVVEAKQELNQILKDSIQQFRTKSEAKIAEHEKSIADFRARIAKKKKANRAEYESKLQALEVKNNDLKKRLDDFKEDSQDKWETFQNTFTRDMDELGEAFKGFAKKNKK